MRFIDEATVSVVAGDGGRGCVSFLREASSLRGGPDGGDGGRGGDVVLVATSSESTLQSFRGRTIFKAGRGRDGQSRKKRGADAPDLEIRVPVGTTVRDADSGELVADLTEDGQRFVVAKGGKGGRGNVHFKTSTRQAPDFAQSGIAGEERRVELTLKLIAEVGLVGLPNAGKSSLIRRISASKAQVGAWPFTTLSPNLGVVHGPRRSFVVADIPGLIEGAHEGAGLGDRFLRHVERTRVLVHVVGVELEQDPVAAWELVSRELESYDESLLGRPTVVVLNKIDLVPRGDRDALAARLRERAEARGARFHVMSCATGEGVQSFLRLLGGLVGATDPEPEPEPWDPTRV